MIIDPSNTKMSVPADQNAQEAQDPPSYDSAIRDISSGPFVPSGTSKVDNIKVPPQAPGPYPNSGAGPIAQSPPIPATVYNYVNPVTHEHIVSLLPPDHPQMVCLQQGGHVPRARFGLLGILAAIFWFPLGVGCCLLDRKVQCERCGIVLDEGLCG
ncbi:hypothetical protein AcW1_009138 [Taiwanofungus camphoratus]|nr:hypothetical protein AcV5_007161 [Antrodia cinnamomea]KAI0949567.1 hypothetical protein AcW1_009138 [Antrodia cinnamomea]KAI0958608.1 hypothetical protein AcV7_004384 [Antrodia cinnamomea]KAI0958609.1 hypothetical protein AcV7_004384 [Antrodia cinnamomea]KAI0958610.1 hypothetical protein AcV7_004384 [Antrodia cinnamomea]